MTNVRSAIALVIGCIFAMAIVVLLWIPLINGDGNHTKELNNWEASATKIADDGYASYYLYTYQMPNGFLVNCIVGQTNKGNSVSIDCPG